MTHRLITSGSEMEERFAYSRAVVDGDWVHVSGTTGFDYAAGTISEDVVEQTEQIFRNIDVALREAGASITDVVRVTYYLLDAATIEAVGPVLKHWLDEARPAATAIVVAGLVDPRMKIEIEATARRR